jgi:hypothetical protein
MVRMQATFTIHKREDPTGTKVVKFATALKRYGAKVRFERMKTKYKVEVEEFTSLDYLMEIWAKYDREAD